jgi:hypothetical protein
MRAVLFDPDKVTPPKTEADLLTDGRATGGNATGATRS